MFTKSKPVSITHATVVFLRWILIFTLFSLHYIPRDVECGVCIL